MADYLSLIELAKTKGTSKITPPGVTIMRSPPLWRDLDHGMNQTVINDVLPSLISEIATLAKLPAPTDAFSVLGGAIRFQSAGNGGG